MFDARLLHAVKFTSLVAVYRAQDLKEEKRKKGSVEHTDLVFREVYKDEYTLEELPMGHVRLAMKEELA